MASVVSRLLFYGVSRGCSRRLYNARTSLVACFPCRNISHRLRPSCSPALLSRHIRLLAPKSFYSTSQDDGAGDGEDEEESTSGSDEGEETSDDEDSDSSSASEDNESLEAEALPVSKHRALATIRVPDFFPNVPILPISRSPIFPRLARMLEAGVIYIDLPASYLCTSSMHLCGSHSEAHNCMISPTHPLGCFYI